MMKKILLALCAANVLFVVSAMILNFVVQRKAEERERQVHADIEAYCPLGITKSQVLKSLALHHIDVGVAENNTVQAIMRDVSGIVIIKSIQITFHFSSENKLVAYQYHAVYTGP